MSAPMLSRRQFAAASMATLAFAGLARCAAVPGAAYRNQVRGFGPLLPDPAGLFDLPANFSYRIISRFGDAMSDGMRVPDRADGMGCFALGGSRVALVRNHELEPDQMDDGPMGDRPGPIPDAYDADGRGHALPGGTTTLVYDHRSGRVEEQYLSLAGTVRNCAGGTTPWGSWLSCEETLIRAGDGGGRDHGWVFEVPSRQRGVVPATPLTGLGRFNHEAVAVDPLTGIVYLSEDEDDGLLYRFLPDVNGRLDGGGRLQALGFRDSPGGGDSRNWHGRDIAVGEVKEVVWIDLAGTDNPDGDLKARGHAAGAVRFARGEGLHLGQGELYLMCTSGGAAELGQIMRYRPSPFEGRPRERDAPGRLQLFVESTDPAVLDSGDNVTVAPWGDLILCEDQYIDWATNHLRGVTPRGRVYAIGRHRGNSELAGACFSPDGSTLFVNIFRPAKTLAITGPWSSREA